MRPFFSRVTSHDGWNEVAVACNTRHIRGYHENEKVIPGYAKTLTFRYNVLTACSPIIPCSNELNDKAVPMVLHANHKLAKRVRYSFESKRAFEREITTLKVLHRKLKEIIGTTHRYIEYNFILFIRKYMYVFSRQRFVD